MDSPRSLWNIISASLGLLGLALLGGCATTASIRHQSLLMQLPGRAPVATLDPYPGISLHLSISCDDRVRFFMISPLVPLPPIIPAMVGSGDQHALVHLEMSREAMYELGQMAPLGEEPRGLPLFVTLTTADGEQKYVLSIPTWDEEGGKGRSFWVRFAANCDDLDGATLVVTPVNPSARHFGSVELRLIYKYSDEVQIAYMQ